MGLSSVGSLCLSGTRDMYTNCHNKLVQDSPRKIWFKRKQEAQGGGDYPQGGCIE